MVSNEERRKIAKKLRAGAEYLPNDMYSDDLELELAKTVCGYDTPSVDVLFNRLADLIEPEPERTCRMEYDTVHGDFVCSECGAWVRTDASRTLSGASMKYCPNCGAKVVSE